MINSIEDIDDVFTWHSPTEGEVEMMKDLRHGARIFAAMILELVPASPDRSVAFRHLRDCIMTCNTAIILKGRH